jgi:bifunctional NMN adenylyltransferase/nudix hydrolase
MIIKNGPNPKEFEVGCIIARLQVHKLHDAHIKLIDYVCSNHKKVILFLGVPVVGNTRSNPLDFATRKAMVQAMYPNLVILPLRDQRSNEKWSKILDETIRIPFGERRAVLYGSRDSFISSFSGRTPVIELEPIECHSGTETRHQVSKEVINSYDFRAGIIYSTHSQRSITYPTVDITAYKETGEILLAKKPNEDKYRFIGGFVDSEDNSLEAAANREFREESGNCEIADIRYVASRKINDWRYAKTEHGVMSTFFIGKFIFGHPTASDDLANGGVVEWKDPKTIDVERDIMPEHHEFFHALKKYLMFESVK